MCMIEFIANDIIEYNGLKRWLVFSNDDVLNNYEINFGDLGVKNLKKAIYVYQHNFYEFKRYFQFVGLLQYTHEGGMLTMSLFECDNMNGFLDSFIDLKLQKWQDKDLVSLGNVISQIIDDNRKSLASIRLKKLL